MTKRALNFLCLDHNLVVILIFHTCPIRAHGMWRIIHAAPKHTINHAGTNRNSKTARKLPRNTLWYTNNTFQCIPQALQILFRSYKIAKETIINARRACAASTGRNLNVFTENNVTGWPFAIAFAYKQVNQLHPFSQVGNRYMTLLIKRTAKIFHCVTLPQTFVRMSSSSWGNRRYLGTSAPSQRIVYLSVAKIANCGTAILSRSS